MFKTLTAIKVAQLSGVNFLFIGIAWFMDLDLDNLEWVKWPTTMGLSTVLYLIYNFYNSKRSNDKVDFDTVANQLRNIIDMHKGEILQLKKEVTEKDEEIERLRKENLSLIKQQLKADKHENH